MHQLHLLILAVAAALGSNEFGTKQPLLFSIKAGSGLNTLQEYRRKSLTETEISVSSAEIPDLFRSSLLNNLGEAIRKFNATVIVFELRENNEVKHVLMRFVNQNEAVDSESWFDNKLFFFKPWSVPDKDVSIQLDATTGGSPRSFLVLAGSANDSCESMSGAVGVADSDSDPCDWVRAGGKAPVIFYSHRFIQPFSASVRYADQILIYMSSSNEFTKVRLQYKAAAEYYNRTKQQIEQSLEARMMDEFFGGTAPTNAES